MRTHEIQLLPFADHRALKLYGQFENGGRQECRGGHACAIMSQVSHGVNLAEGLLGPVEGLKAASAGYVEPLQLAGKTVYNVAGDAFFLCLEQALTLDVIRAMAERKPERVVCLGAGFVGNDQLKANAMQIFKTKGVTSFKIV
jgi:hypothetical protein